jgi:hypothetical protein
MRPPNRSGGRQPAVDVVTASATAFVHGRPAGRPCAAIVVLPLQARYTNHSWLTPAAPDARRRCTEKAIFAVHNRMFPGAAGVSPPWPANRTQCRKIDALFADSATPEQERRVLARRGVRYGRCAARINALLADDATPEQKSQASPRRGFWNRAGNGDRFSRVNYICTAHPASAPRLAYASRS